MDGLIFDKDGTLFDFRASWGAWTEAVVTEFASDAADAARLYGVLGYHPATRDFDPQSPVIAMSTPEIAEILHRNLPGIPFAALNERLNRLSADAPMLPAVDLPRVLGALKAQGLVLGLATNDTEAPARLHLERAGVLDLFDFVVGCDSGWGGKPAPGQLLEFLRRFDLTPSRVAMVGDSLHDLHAGQAAGMRRIAVLTGIAGHDDLAGHADVVLPDIGGIAGWIEAQAAA